MDPVETTGQTSNGETGFIQPSTPASVPADGAPVSGNLAPSKKSSDLMDISGSEIDEDEESRLLSVQAINEAYSCTLEVITDTLAEIEALPSDIKNARKFDGYLGIIELHEKELTFKAGLSKNLMLQGTKAKTKLAFQRRQIQSILREFNNHQASGSSNVNDDSSRASLIAQYTEKIRQADSEFKIHQAAFNAAKEASQQIKRETEETFQQSFVDFCRYHLPDLNLHKDDAQTSANSLPRLGGTSAKRKWPSDSNLSSISADPPLVDSLQVDNQNLSSPASKQTRLDRVISEQLQNQVSHSVVSPLGSLTATQSTQNSNDTPSTITQPLHINSHLNNNQPVKAAVHFTSTPAPHITTAASVGNTALAPRTIFPLNNISPSQAVDSSAPLGDISIDTVREQTASATAVDNISTIQCNTLANSSTALHNRVNFANPDFRALPKIWEISPGSSSQPVSSALKTPKFFLQRWDGKVTTYPNFINSFNQYVHLRTDFLEPQKIQLLHNVLPRDIVFHFQTFNCDADGYKARLQYLHERFGDTSKLRNQLWLAITAFQHPLPNLKSIRDTADKMQTAIATYRRYAQGKW